MVETVADAHPRDVCHLDRVERGDRRRLLPPCEHRRDGEVRHRQRDGCQRSEHLDTRRRQADLLVRLTQRRGDGVRVVGLNLFAGDLAGADAGMMSVPGREADVRANVDVVVAVGEQLGIPAFNALYGVRLEGVDPQQQDELAVANLTHVAERVATIGGTVLVEPVSGPKPYPLRTADDVVAVLDRVAAEGTSNVAFLCDLFHLANNGDDLDAVVDRHADRVGHVQVADHPGRHEPGTGSLDLDRYLGRLQEAGYAGHVALEYVPSTSTLDSLAWLPAERRG